MKRNTGFCLLMLLALINLPYCEDPAPILGKLSTSVDFVLSKNQDADQEDPYQAWPEVILSSPFPIITSKDISIEIRTPKEALATIITLPVADSEILSYGVCWSNHTNTTTSDNYCEEKTLFRPDNHFHVGYLNISTTYYLRPFATNSLGTTYGTEISFTTPAAVPPPVFNPEVIYGSIQDIDGNNYRTVQVGDQTWMAENLKTTRYNDGLPIVLGSGGPAGYTEWFSITGGAYCWYDNDYQVFKEYGAIYNWTAAATGHLCPSGWHVPSEKEWTTLVTFLGAKVGVYSKDTENGLIHWGESVSRIYESGFTPVPTGFLDGWGFLPGGDFWWTATPYYEEYGTTSAFLVSFNIKAIESPSYGYSVRCLKDY